MNVFRKQIIRFLLNGKQVPKGTPKAKRVREHSQRFYGTLRTVEGTTKQIPLTDERESSETLLRRLQTEEDSKRANGADRYHDERKRPIGELLAKFAE